MFTTDTRKSSCPIRIMYGPETFDDTGRSVLNDNIHASGLRDKPDRLGTSWNCRWPLAIIKLTEHSDYSGGDVEASNFRVLHDQFPELVQIYGSHGYQALAYDATLGPIPDSEELCEILDGLESYCIIDDDDHSDLEMTLETEAWNDWGRKDFRKALTSLLDAIDKEHEHEIPDDDAVCPDSVSEPLAAMTHPCSDALTWQTALWDLWRAGCDSLNVNGGSGFMVETGQQVYFFIDEWRAKAGMDKRYAMDKPIHAALRKLAEATRVSD